MAYTRAMGSRRRLPRCGLAAVLLLTACRGILGLDDLPAAGSAAFPDAATLDGAVSNAISNPNDANASDSTTDASVVESDARSATDAVVVPPGSDGAAAGVPAMPLPPPSPLLSNYLITADTVSDKTTGLVWQRAMHSGAGERYPQAFAYCTNLDLAGETDWQLPTRLELISILDYGQRSTNLSPELFPDRPMVPFQTTFWTRSVDIRHGSFDDRWTVDAYAGGLGSGAIGADFLNYLARCVRSSKATGAALRIVQSSSATAYDPVTGLTWQTAMSPSAASLSDAMSYCDTASIGPFGSGWRLPNIRELQSILDETQQVAPLWDPLFMSNAAHTTRLWSSTASNPSSENHTIDFGTGSASVDPLYALLGVRCVH